MAGIQPGGSCPDGKVRISLDRFQCSPHAPHAISSKIDQYTLFSEYYSRKFNHCGGNPLNRCACHDSFADETAAAVVTEDNCHARIKCLLSRLPLKPLQTQLDT